MNPMLHIRTKVFRVDQAEMARIAGVAQSTISRWETGRGDPGLDDVRRIRSAAKERRLRWSDRVLFDPPAPASVAVEPARAQA